MALHTITREEQSHREFLSFRLGNEEYGIDILKVQEIRGCDHVTAIANTPEFIKGVIDLRGIIVPIIDMRVKFALAQADYNDFTVVIIINVAERVVGMVVDGVSDVITLDAQQVKPPPALSASLDTQYIMGLGKIADRMIILLDIEQLMTSEGMALIDDAAGSAPAH